MKRGVEARVLAATLIGRILDEGAYSNIVVRTATRDLERRDALFVQRLTYQTIRYLDRIDRIIDARIARPVDDHVRAVLRVGVAEIVFAAGDVHAAVDTAVEAARVVGAARATGFVNGVLRGVAREGEPALPSGPEGDALRLGYPEWLLEDLAGTYGEAEAQAFLQASNRATKVGVRRRRGPAPGEPIAGIPDAFVLDDVTDHRAGIADGSLTVADPSSIAVPVALDPRSGDRTVDLAAAPGGKTLHLWDLIGGTNRVTAMDRHPGRAATASRRLARRRAVVDWVIGDAATPPFVRARFDRVLLDAPCTGLGTLRRRPEIRHRIEPGDAVIAGRRQRRMIEAALSLLRPGGRLVYSVCTITEEETIGAVDGLGSRPPEGIPGADLGTGVLLAPHITGSDGMFIAVIEP